MINLNQLRVFYEAARTGSFTSAAKKLCITQPAVTAQIKTFEDQCNLKLFKKKGRSLYLSEEGTRSTSMQEEFSSTKEKSKT